MIVCQLYIPNIPSVEGSFIAFKNYSEAKCQYIYSKY